MEDILYDYIQSSKFYKHTLQEFNNIFNQEMLGYLTPFLEQGILIYEDGYYYKFNHAKYIKGNIRLNAKGFGFIDTDYGSYYINKNDLLFSMDNDEVIAKKNSDDEAKVIKILKRNTTKLVGLIKFNHQKCIFLADNQKIQQKIELLNIQDFKLVNGHKVIVEIVDYQKTLKANIIEIIGHKDEVGVDVASILLEHDIELTFNQDVLTEVSGIDETIELDNRKDLRNLMTITIDGEDAKDLDDAISLIKEHDQIRLYVHIADVSHYVQENTALDLSARNRGTSVYVVDRVVPMLPQYLSNGICSLHPNVDRYTITCEMLFDKHGEVVEYEIYPSIINSNYRMSYTQVNDLLNGNMQLIEQYQPIYNLCVEALNLSNKITTLRKEAGMIDFDTKESKIHLDHKGRVVDVTLLKRNKVHRLIENFMISANECVAEFLYYQQLPCLYRIHLEPETKKMKEFTQFLKVLGIRHKLNLNSLHPKQLQTILNKLKKLDSYPIVAKMLLRSMQKAYYEADCKGHFGLALDHYVHFTSPIRRYPDLIVHRSLRKFFFHQQFDNMDRFAQDITEIAKHASIKERNAIDAERAVEDLKKCEYMKKFIGKRYSGIISGIQKFGIFVELDNTIEGLIHTKNLPHSAKYHEILNQMQTKYKNYKIGDRVMIEVQAVNVFERKIDFMLIEKGLKKQYEKNRSFKSKSKA